MEGLISVTLLNCGKGRSLWVSPLRVTSSRYVPGTSDPTRYAPSALVAASNAMPVSSLMTRTLAPGTLPPVVSLTIPMTALVPLWAKPSAGLSATATIKVTFPSLRYNIPAVLHAPWPAQPALRDNFDDLQMRSELKGADRLARLRRGCCGSRT